MAFPKVSPSQRVLNQGWTYSEQTHPAAVGQTVLDYYSQRYNHSSRSLWRSRIEAGQILIDGQVVTPDTRLKARQQLTYNRPPWYEPVVPLTIKRLYEDEDVWAIAKPSGLPVLPGGGFLNHTLLRQLQLHHPEETLTPIHRLGRGTSGVMLVARSPLARSHLSQQLRDHNMTKIYRALAGRGDRSDPMPDRFTITTPIGKVPHPTLGDVHGATDAGKFARSDCQVLERRSEATLLEVSILTGRPHQIRIHLASYGYPLLGDPLYGVGGIPSGQVEEWIASKPDFKSKSEPKAETASESSEPDLVAPTEPKSRIRNAVPGDCGYWLHAHRLGFTHPRTGKRLEIIAPPPPILSNQDDR